jgi:imidazolonepropionase-like amidohydrolase
LRETLIKAQEYKDKLLKYSKNEKGKKPKTNLAMEALLPVLRQETPVMVHCERKDDILTAIRIADEFKLKIILDGATDAYKVVEEIKERDIPVILTNLFRGMGNIEDKGFNPKNPVILSRAGIKIAFRYSEGSWVVPGAGNPGGDLLEIAALAVKNGLPIETALKAITIDAARIIGMEKCLGSLEPGKNADILILRGHPLATGSIPEAVFIKGELVYKREAGKRTSYNRGDKR